MREFNYKQYVADILDKDVIDLLTSIYAKKGVVEYFINSNPELVKGYAEITKVQNAVSAYRKTRYPGVAIKKVFEWKLGLCDSCNDRIERCWELQDEWLSNDNGSFVIDKEYIDSFSEIFSSLNWFGIGRKKEKYRSSDGVYALCDGGSYADKNSIDIELVIAEDIENYLELMTIGLKDVLLDGVNPLLVLPMFLADMIKITPFGSYDEEVAYLTMLRVLFNGDFESIKYISLIRFLEQNRIKLLESIEKSLESWNEGNNDYKHVVIAFLEIVDEMYQQSTEQIVPLYTRKMNKQERIDHAISTYGTIFTKVEISILCPDASSSSIENVLADYSGWKINGGRAAAYDPLGFKAGVRHYYLRYD
ncbi:MAG: hypothetical protein IKY78_09720 [Clostridia bacterium]|nr:hypothetical protein [Clostridia bacterium]